MRQGPRIARSGHECDMHALGVKDISMPATPEKFGNRLGNDMDDFSYHRPKDVEEAVSLYQSADDPMYLSGGMTLIPTMKQRLAEPTDVIDLSGLPELTA